VYVTPSRNNVPTLQGRSIKRSAMHLHWIMVTKPRPKSSTAALAPSEKNKKQSSRILQGRSKSKSLHAANRVKFRADRQMRGAQEPQPYGHLLTLPHRHLRTRTLHQRSRSQQPQQRNALHSSVTGNDCAPQKMNLYVMCNFGTGSDIRGSWAPESRLINRVYGCRADLAQLVERVAFNHVVVGSSPTVGEKFEFFEYDQNS
jgi:hypothetical protein